MLRLLMATCAFVAIVESHAAAQGPLSVFDYSIAPSSDQIRTVDVQKALIWTQHYGAMVDGDYGRMTRAAVESWQRSQSLQPTGVLEPSQAAELVRQGMAARDHWGWATFRDERVGFSIGYPGRLFSPGRRTEHGGVEFTTSIPTGRFSVGVLPNISAGVFKSVFDVLANPTEPGAKVHYSVRTEHWYVIAGVSGDYWYYQRAERRPSGLASFTYRMSHEDASKFGFLVTAVSNSFRVEHDIRPQAAAVPSPGTGSASPPAVQRPSPGPSLSGPTSAGAYGRVEQSGKIEGIKLRLAGSDPELRAQDVFRRVSGAVYVVAAFTDNGPAHNQGLNQGSAVAVSDRHLLTNCHVVGGAPTVFVVREGVVVRADVVSAYVSADRCVLRAETALPAFVAVRPFVDLSVGETVYSIGAPQGLELTIATGLLSSKRTFDGGARFIQTSAPISPGSSGGGLFDVYGNLVGITTLTRRDSQNLNFAIPAEDYAR